MNAFDDIAIAPQSFAYRDLLGRDKWEAWTPTRTLWTDVGTPTISARYRVVGRQCFIQIYVDPTTSIATTAGSSYTDLPIAAKGLAGAGSMVNMTTNVAVGSCVVDVTNSRLYVPTLIASGNNFAIAAWYEV